MLYYIRDIFFTYILTPVTSYRITALLILTGAAILRFLNYGDFSFSNDELSALCRLHFGNLGELWEHGVKPDGHPALVQTFLWLWIQVFPPVEWSVRIPFVLTGIASVWLVYLVCKRWFGTVPALLAMGCMAFLEYTVIYSLIARPYAFGVFFTLLSVWCLQKYRDIPGRTYTWLIGFGLSALAAMYTHYFAFLQVGLIAVSGIFIVGKGKRLPYLAALAVIVAGFIPHIWITLAHMKTGGVTWLGKPGKDWYVQYLDYAFNHDILVWGTLVFLFFIGWGCYILRNLFSGKTFRTWLMVLAWALLPFVAGYLYSRYKSPMLQYSVLLFAFPFLLMAIAMPLAAIPERISRVIAGLFCLLLVFSTVVTNYHFTKDYFGVFRPIAENMRDFRKDQGDRGLIVAGFNHPCYVEHYFNEWKQEMPVDIFYGEEETKNLASLHQVLKDGKKETVAFGWSNVGVSAETRELIRYYRPYMNRREFHVNSEYYEFSATPERAYIDDIRWRTVPGDDCWQIDSAIIRREGAGQIYYDMSGREYGMKCSIALSNYHSSRFTLVTARCRVIRRDADMPSTSPGLVAEIKRNGKNIHYRTKDFGYFNADSDTSGILMVSFPLYMPDIRAYRDTLDFYLWNSAQGLVYTSDWTIEAREFNPVIHGYHQGGQ